MPIKTVFALVVASLVSLTGCLQGGPGLSNVRAGGGDESVAGGSAGPQGSQGSNALRRCAKPVGTAALVEEKDVGTVLMQYRLPTSPLPLVRLLMQQSNCFQVVDRGAGLRAVETERRLARQGLTAGNAGRVRLVAADYTITANVVFSEKNAGGGAAGIGVLFGPLGAIAGAVAGAMKFKEAQVLLFATDNRTGVQVASATGTGKATDIGVGAGVLGSGLGGGAGAWGNTNEGKVVAAALVDALNKLVAQMQSTAKR